MAEWTKWQDLEEEVLDDNDDAKARGVYQVRFVNAAEEPIAIPRLAGTDNDGIYCIGKTLMSFRRRLKDFLSGPHSEGERYEKIAENLSKAPGFQEHYLQYRVRSFEGRELVEEFEAVYLAMYFEKFCELPPGNHALPRKALERFLEKLPKSG